MPEIKIVANRTEIIAGEGGVLDAIHGPLRKVPFAMRAVAIDEAIFKAADIPVNIARRKNRGFVDRTGRLRRSVKKQSRTFSGGDSQGFPLLRKFTNIIAGGVGARQAIIIDQGTKPRFASGKYRGIVKARDFVSKALEESAPQMHSVVLQYARAKLDAVANFARKGSKLTK